MFALKSDLTNAIEHYPDLKIIERDGKLSLSGDVDLLHPIGQELIDTFAVDITFPERFPYCFPEVIETSGKIERIAKRHVFTNTNTLCFAVKVEERLKCKGGITTRWFLDNVLVPRLAEEYVVNHGGKYEHEFSHGPLGDLEFYFQKFNTKDPLEVIRNLKLILNGGFPKHYEKCVCGSDLRFKKCHRTVFEALKDLGDRYIAYEIDNLEGFLKAVVQKIDALTSKNDEK